MLKANNFEGGSNGTTITAGNSGGASGDAFNAVVGSPQYTTTQRRGNLAAFNPTVGADVHMDYTGVSQPGDVTCVRLHMYLVSGTTNFQRAVVLLNGTSSFVAALWVFGNVLAVYTGLATAEQFRSAAVPIGQWIRVELRLTINSSNSGTGELWIYNNPDSTTPSQTLTTGTITWPGRAPSAAEFHLQRDSGGYWYVDDIGVSDTLLGPTSASKAATDFGTLTNLAGVTAAPQRSDSGALVERAGIGLARADTGHLADQASVQVAHARSDTGHLTDQAGVQVAHARVDGGHLSEQATVQVAHARADGGTLTEGPRVISLASADGVALGELSDVDQAFGPSTSDLGQLADQGSVTAAPQRTDQAMLGEQAAVEVLRLGTETALLTEVSGIAIPAMDGGALTEVATVTAVLTSVDSLVLGELAQALQPLAAFDTAALEEFAHVISLGGDITSIGPPYIDWVASTPYA